MQTHSFKGIGKQVGGDHYQGAIQPFQLSMANGHDACTHAIQKYLTRFERKAGIEDLKKAHHIAMIRYDTMMMYGVHHPPEKPLINILDYTKSNKTGRYAAACILICELWHRMVDCDHLDRAEKLRAAIRDCAKHHYPKLYKEEDFI
ncbi:DUF3310 domain-containing protein [Synechococcus virus S-ESS1]|uniref:DUF3310 domain-containing protein n=1 Tax=Synechococcus virus S-ESS1 TaxID=1964565 RepID=A0A1V0DX53_9CAUD|nr:DUF3310 domain-containing protein [Synechococcus virus S-ESS1]ARB05733.1 DUF3310 domain-containing protein [Synechococcus virus S-ESS1]